MEEMICLPKARYILLLIFAIIGVGFFLVFLWFYTDPYHASKASQFFLKGMAKKLYVSEVPEDLDNIVKNMKQWLGHPSHNDLRYCIKLSREIAKRMKYEKTPYLYNPLKEGMKGDCKHAAILIGNLLENQGIDYEYYLLKLDKNSILPNHIVVVIKGTSTGRFVIDPFYEVAVKSQASGKIYRGEGLCLEFNDYHKRFIYPLLEKNLNRR